MPVFLYHLTGTIFLVHTNAKVSCSHKNLAKGLKVEGIGQVAWSMHGNTVMIRLLIVPTYHVSNSSARLLSTSSVLQTYPEENIIRTQTGMSLMGVKGDSRRGKITATVIPVTKLPTTTTFHDERTQQGLDALTNVISVIDEASLNISEANKDLLRWYAKIWSCRDTLQYDANRRVSDKRWTTASAQCDACQYIRQTGKTSAIVKDRQSAIKKGHVQPMVAVDHYICSTRVP